MVSGAVECGGGGVCDWSCDRWWCAVECGGGVGGGEEEEECARRHGAKLQLVLLPRRQRAPMRYSH